jgi:photosystem II stability/assembly factor-like uncharacterized protein
MVSLRLSAFLAAAILAACTTAEDAPDAEAILEAPYIRDLEFVDASVGYAVGQGTILRTADGGKTWIRQNAVLQDYLYSAAFRGRNFGIVAGDDGALLVTRDGGKTWSLPGDYSYKGDIYAVAIADDKVAVAVGEQGRAFRTTDGGETWGPLAMGTLQSLNAVAFATSRTGMIVGNENLLLRTTNGGATWTPLSIGREFFLNRVAFLDSAHGYASSGAPLLLATDDGGATWAEIPGFVGGYDLAFSSEKVAYAVEDSKVFKTTNGGAAWREIWNADDDHFEEDPAFSSIVALDDSRVLVAGSGIFSTSDGGATWKRVLREAR